jgi:N-acetylmuramoyl-L-alanine amidase
MKRRIEMEHSNQVNSSSSLFKVIAGSFQLRKNAEERVAFLGSKGIESFVQTTTISGVMWFRVQAGAFSNRENAESRLDEVKKSGVLDAFITTAGDTSSDENSTEYTILGETTLTAEQMNQFVKKINPQAIELGAHYVTFGKEYGIRGDIAFAQAMHETNFFRFTGVVQPDQNNYSGIGATGGGVQGARFSNPEEGVLAHIQHLYAYASTNPLPNKHPLVDPRFNLVTRGSAPTWVHLNGKWAVPGDGYGQSIITLYERMVNEMK